MELDVTTFVLEIVNFLVLLWLLTRFLYRPVTSALAARAQAAASQREELRSRSATLDARAAELEQQRQKLVAQREAAERDLANEMSAQRQKQFTELGRELDAERERARARLDQEQIRTREQDERELRRRAADFVAQYLRRLAAPPIEAAVMELFLAELAEQSQDARIALRDGWSQRHEGAPVIDVTTAFAPPADLRERVESQIGALMGQAARTQWRIDPALLAGICVHLPGYSLEASLRRGVDAFAAEAVGR
jgi:F-type H+-transporting ATPase subunit b